MLSLIIMGQYLKFSGTDKGVSGGLLSHLWLVSGEITFKNDDDVFTVRVDEESEYCNYLMEEIYIDGAHSLIKLSLIQ